MESNSQHGTPPVKQIIAEWTPRGVRGAHYPHIGSDCKQHCNGGKPVSVASMSRHLSVLENAGLISSERKGRRVLYRLKPDSLVNTLTGFALEICPVAGPLTRESRALAKRARTTE
jgi:hypothetical protein